MYIPPHYLLWMIQWINSDKLIFVVIPSPFCIEVSNHQVGFRLLRLSIPTYSGPAQDQALWFAYSFFTVRIDYHYWLTFLHDYHSISLLIYLLISIHHQSTVPRFTFSGKGSTASSGLLPYRRRFLLPEAPWHYKQFLSEILRFLTLACLADKELLSLSKGNRTYFHCLQPVATKTPLFKK